MKYSAVIVEDEIESYNRLKRLLQPHEHQLEIIGHAENGIQAVQLIQGKKPDVVFLDIDLPGMNGFEVLKKIEYPAAVVFTTAHDNYALEAFRVNAINYLLKPFDEEDIENALLSLQKVNFNISVNFKSNRSSRPNLNFIPCKMGSKIYLIEIEKIHFISYSSEVISYHTDEKDYYTDSTLSKIESTLDSEVFRKINKNQIVNMNSICKLNSTSDGKYTLTLKDRTSTQLIISRKYAGPFKDFLNL